MAEGIQGRMLDAGTEGSHGGMLLTTSPGLLSCLSYTPQVHLSRNGTSTDQSDRGNS